ncbi:hypothetical protein CEY04_11260 [Achromobacter sp. HZ28]|nr:hypothetical protein CEY05_20720 [Achromobacter sp. HZ34]OWT79543.1 hypothetical protein CEY04_11260 [Achromobacter sp. HZ28]
MSDDIDAGVEAAAPTWAVFGDLMSVLLGSFVLVLLGVIGMQLDLSSKLQEEVKQRQEETQRRETLEEALAVPLAQGRITLVNGRIGISGNVLFALNSDQLQPEGREVLQSLVLPLTRYLQNHAEILMVSGFTDNQQIHEGNRRFADNLDLSAQRALTVTRALIEAGVPRTVIFAAAFGAEQPVASNDDEEGRAKNRRVEIAPIPRQTADGKPAQDGDAGPTPSPAASTATPGVAVAPAAPAAPAATAAAPAAAPASATAPATASAPAAAPTTTPATATAPATTPATAATAATAAATAAAASAGKTGGSSVASKHKSGRNVPATKTHKSHAAASHR